MPFSTRALAVTIALVAHVALARAEETVRIVGSTPLTFAVPRGHCLLEETNARDAIFIRNISTLLRNANNKLILVTIECGRRAAWRDGKGPIYDYATYYLPDNVENQVYDGETQALRKSLCDDMRKQGDATLAPVKDMVANAAKELNSKVAVNSTKLIGVVGEDQHGCYVALLVGVHGNDGRNFLMSTLVTSTVVRGKAIFLGNYHEYKGPETTERSLREAKATAAAFDARNP